MDIVPKITVGSTITVENPPEELVQWCNEHLKIRNPDYAKKARMHLWTGKTPQYLFLYEKHGDALTLPFGTLREVLSLCPQRVLEGDFGDGESIDYNCNVPLYDYQQTAVNALFYQRYGILQSPAGSGKTQMGIALIAKLGKRALWLTHTADLLNQSKSRAEQYMDKNLIGTITEGKVNIGSGITFATVQTMCRLDLSQYKYTWDTIIVDECHRVSGSPTSVTQFSKVLNSLSARHKYGLSATVHRSDGMIAATYAMVGQVVHAVPEEAVGDRVLKVGIIAVGTGVKLSRECMNTDGTLNHAKMINYLCNDEDRSEIIVDHIIKNASRSSLILSDRLEHLSNLIDALPFPMQEDAVMISGKMTTKKAKAEREQAIEDMRTGKKKYLFATYSLCKEGLDIPCLEVLHMTTPQKDFAVITQSIGRVARVREGKADPVCYDYVDDSIYLMKAYKKRCTTYKKIGCYFTEGTSK